MFVFAVVNRTAAAKILQNNKLNKAKTCRYQTFVVSLQINV